ncbi:hypothetical protein BS333_06010 [Vibrio azureus]|uniref:Glycosyltransferase n=1 Tax=Vibrio azureus NBRC 104587 TaxID=1219077 RepID=U3C760_9VIBR|nr:glycosyltransferase family 4 protein [Vibrio azureus]AUI85971.1 hypothetical protein BS333_06010 [Vibrio azureus]GAD74278.1 hypothetical protein VAZ01S_008_00200 [Vibrio azureus NBRC 104587]
MDDRIKPRPPVVFCWAMISPKKRGSFEDYLAGMGREAQKRGWRFIVCVIEPSEPALKEWLTSSGCELLCLDEKTMANTAQIISLLKKNQADILHTHFIGPTDLAILKCKLAWGGKIVFTDHSSNPLQAPAKGNIFINQLRSFRQYTFSLAVCLYLPVSDFVAQRIARNIPPAKNKIHRLYNGIDLSRFSMLESKEQRCALKQQTFGFEDDLPVVAFIGQLIIEKGIDRFLKAIKKLLLEELPCRFIIVGDGIYRQQVEEFCSEESFAGRVKYLGLRSDVHEILKITDLFVMPSQWGEAFGLTAIEASAASVAIVASKVGGLSEVVLDGQTGVLIEHDDDDSLEQSIRSLILDPERCLMYGRNGRQHAEDSFQLKDMLQNTFNYYQSVLSSGTVP